MTPNAADSTKVKNVKSAIQGSQPNEPNNLVRQQLDSNNAVRRKFLRWFRIWYPFLLKPSKIIFLGKVPKCFMFFSLCCGSHIRTSLMKLHVKQNSVEQKYPIDALLKHMSQLMFFGLGSLERVMAAQCHGNTSVNFELRGWCYEITWSKDKQPDPRRRCIETPRHEGSECSQRREHRRPLVVLLPLTERRPRGYMITAPARGGHSWVADLVWFSLRPHPPSSKNLNERLRAGRRHGAFLAAALYLLAIWTFLSFAQMLTTAHELAYFKQHLALVCSGAQHLALASSVARDSTLWRLAFGTVQFTISRFWTLNLNTILRIFQIWCPFGLTPSKFMGL